MRMKNNRFNHLAVNVGALWCLQKEETGKRGISLVLKEQRGIGFIFYRTLLP